MVDDKALWTDGRCNLNKGEEVGGWGRRGGVETPAGERGQNNIRVA